MDGESNRSPLCQPFLRVPPDEEKVEEEAQRALKERPHISVRLRITLSFMVLFVLLCGMAVAVLIFISILNHKHQFLEKTSNYAFEIQQARRYEKNFFLYGTNLYDALSNVQAAHNILRINSEDLIPVIGGSVYEEMEKSLNDYEDLLERLSRLSALSGNKEGPEISTFESQLRRYGAEIIANASSLIDKERLELNNLISNAKFVTIVSLVFFLIVIAYIINMLTRQILRPISRAVDYTQRIADGDFTPVRPRRKYRDEFSSLAIAINRMIHEIRIRQEQLTQSRKMAAIGTLTAGITHELNNPLNNISLTAEALIDGFDDYSREEKRKMLGEISAQVERASSTVSNLLDFARVERPLFEPLSIEDIINMTVNLLKNELVLNDITLKKHLERNLPRIRGSARNLQQVFLNLLLNSIQAMPEGGEITINAGRSDRQFIKIDVSDSGCGISPENLDKIFDPFFTTKEVGKGTGLGLSVSYGIVENHGGKISVTSVPEEGTTFSVFLPSEASQNSG